jgi:uncharacterized damage-inducible protein DinB
MTEDDIPLLYEYDRWANNRVFKATSALSVEQFLRLLRISESISDLPFLVWVAQEQFSGRWVLSTGRDSIERSTRASSEGGR